MMMHEGPGMTQNYVVAGAGLPMGRSTGKRKDKMAKAACSSK
jgi:hypothetical protein